MLSRDGDPIIPLWIGYSLYLVLTFLREITQGFKLGGKKYMYQVWENVLHKEMIKGNNSSVLKTYENTNLFQIKKLWDSIHPLA